MTATTTEKPTETIRVPVRLDVDTHAASFAKAMSHLDNASALAFTEAVSLVAQTHVPVEAYGAAAEHYSADELGALAVASRAWEPALDGGSA